MPVMSSTALDKIDELHHLIQSIDITSNGSGPAAPVGDYAWNPVLPLSHTPSSWGLNAAGVEKAKELRQKLEDCDKVGAVPASQPKQQKPKQQKQKQKKQQKARAGADQPPFSRVDFCVGRVVDVEVHPDADKMYIEKIDVGEAEPRIIVSGLRDFIPADKLKGASLIVFANLKPAKLRGVLSYGMVLATANADRTVVELVAPPAGSKPGDRITLQGEDYSEFEPLASINAKKKNNAWEVIRPDLLTNTERVACYEGKALLVNGSPCAAPTLSGAHLS